jgi:hypothetical protein
VTWIKKKRLFAPDNLQAYDKTGRAIAPDELTCEVIHRAMSALAAPGLLE